MKTYANLLATVLNFVAGVCLYLALDIGPLPTKQELAPGLTVDNSGSRIMGVPAGKLALVNAERPALARTGLLLLAVGFFLQVGTAVADVKAARRA